jgi:hypothetical protein
MAPGFNPKDTAETYVRKLLVNQERMKLTIERYEEEQKRKLQQNDEPSSEQMQVSASVAAS